MPSSLKKRLFILAAFFALLGLVFLLAAGNSLLIWHRNPAPVEMALGNYVQINPAGDWLRLTDCWVDYPHAVCLRKKLGGEISEISVPVYPGNDFTRPARVILAVPDDRREEAIAGNKPRGVRIQTIEGLIRSGPFYTGLSDKLRSAAPWRLADRYIILDEGRQPSLNSVAVCLLIFVIIFFSVARAVSILINPNARVVRINGKLRVVSTPLGARV